MSSFPEAACTPPRGHFCPGSDELPWQCQSYSHIDNSWTVTGAPVKFMGHPSLLWTPEEPQGKLIVAKVSGS